jgi:serine/alanine adding enzyme
MIVDVLTTKEASKWRRHCGDHMVFALPEYARLKERHSSVQSRLLVVSDGSGSLVMPFFTRTATLGDTHVLLDLSTPEFTGPYMTGAPGHPGKLSEYFVRALQEYSDQEHIVTQFAHLHPWETWLRCLVHEDICFDREIVYVDLGMSQERLWEESFTYACRKNIRKAEREGVRVFEASSIRDIEEFHRIYTSTMQRNKAAERYFFPKWYFERFYDAMPRNSRFVLAELGGTVIAGTLYLFDSRYMFSYLGGADEAYQHVRPTNAVVYSAIQTGQRLGLRYLVLGGGYRPDDGIFRFKSSFSPLRERFYTYRHVHLEDSYQSLCEAANVSGEHREGTFFPPYYNRILGRHEEKAT